MKVRRGIRLFDIDVILYDLSDIQYRFLLATEFMLDNRTSIRRTADEFMISKSSLHRFLHNDLKHISDDAYCQIKALLRKNWDDRNNRKRFPARK